jgi:hypothetical protein
MEFSFPVVAHVSDEAGGKEEHPKKNVICTKSKNKNSLIELNLIAKPHL